MHPSAPSAPTIVFYVSGHGFGHASRVIEVINALGDRAPDVRVQIRTAAPRWLFDLTLRHPADVVQVECDTGIVQIDSLRLDERASIERAAAFHRELDARADDEARALSDVAARLVVGDMPALAFAAAARAGVPAVALGNFTWDWIYEDYPAAGDAPDLLETIRAAYRTAREAWRLPMWGGFDAFERVVDVPMIARRSRRDARDVRRALDLPDDVPVVLSSFGGFGVRDLALERVDCLDRCVVVVAEPGRTRLQVRPRSTRFQPRRETSLKARTTSPVRLDEHALYASGLRYEDLVAAADVVVTKPGYGIIAECAANDTAIVYTSRGRFREYDVLVREMPRYVRSEFLPQDDLLAGRWGAAIDRVLAKPRPSPTPRTDGASTTTELILHAL
jgi:L-arabinokinase